MQDLKSVTFVGIVTLSSGWRIHVSRSGGPFRLSKSFPSDENLTEVSWIFLPD